MIVTGPGVVEWVAKKTNEFGNYGCAEGIGWKKDVLIAGVAYNEYNGVNVSMHVASDGSRRWLKREFLAVCFDYPFNQLKVKRVTGLVGEGNLSARRFIEHLGFKLETTLRDAHPTGKLLVYRMYRSECEWISRDFSKLIAKAA